MMMPLGVSFIQETTVFRRVRAAVGQHDAAVVRGRAEGRQSRCRVDHRRRRALLHADRRERRVRLASATASRAGVTRQAIRSSAATPRCAATSTASSGQRALLNAELRFPLIHAMATPIGILAVSVACSSPTSAAPGSRTRASRSGKRGRTFQRNTTGAAHPADQRI